MPVHIPNPIEGQGLQFDNLLSQLFNLLFIVAGALAVLMIIVSGMLFIVSFGNEERRGRAGRTFLHAVVGLIVVFLAYILVNLLLTFLGVTPAYRLNGS